MIELNLVPNIYKAVKLITNIVPIYKIHTCAVSNLFIFRK